MTSVAMEVFGWKKSTAEKKAWDPMKEPDFIDEVERINNVRDSDQPIEKDDKLSNLKVLIDEAFNARNVEDYIRLVKLDNEMQGHNRSTEVQEGKAAAEVTLIGTLVKQLREQNKELKSANQEIVPIEVKKVEEKA